MYLAVYPGVNPGKSKQLNAVVNKMVKRHMHSKNSILTQFLNASENYSKIIFLRSVCMHAICWTAAVIVLGNNGVQF